MGKIKYLCIQVSLALILFGALHSEGISLETLALLMAVGMTMNVVADRRIAYYLKEKK